MKVTNALATLGNLIECNDTNLSEARKALEVIQIALTDTILRENGLDPDAVKECGRVFIAKEMAKLEAKYQRELGEPYPTTPRPPTPEADRA